MMRKRIQGVSMCLPRCEFRMYTSAKEQLEFDKDTQSLYFEYKKGSIFLWVENNLKGHTFKKSISYNRMTKKSLGIWFSDCLGLDFGSNHYFKLIKVGDKFRLEKKLT